MVTGVQPVQLHDEVPVDKQLLIVAAAVAAASPEHLLVPPARRLDVRDGDHRLRPHGRNTLVGHVARLSAGLAAWLGQTGCLHLLPVPGGRARAAHCHTDEPYGVGDAPALDPVVPRPQTPGLMCDRKRSRSSRARGTA
jgi:hypothetical protein